MRSSAFLLCILAIAIPRAIPAADVKGSSDHPEVGRFSGSEILGYKYHKFNEYLFPEGELRRNENGGFEYAKSSIVDGKVTRILYLSPQDTSVAEVFRNYETQLKKKGFEEIFGCKGDTHGCGYFMPNMDNFKPELIDYAYQIGENRYVSLKKKDPKGDIYVSILVYNYTFSHFRDRYGRPMVQLDIIEAEPLDASQIEVVTAEKIGKEVAKLGHIAIYGIYFDTDRANLKPESESAIDEIAKSMKADPHLKLFVVGHTDNQGGVQYNMDLSHRRATAVRDALVNDHGIDIDRLGAVGMGFFAPVATNRSEEGRALNRRVELVEF